MIKAAPSVSQANVLRPDVLDPPGLLYDLTSASHAYSNTNASQPSTNFVEQKLYTDDELELFLIEWINNPSCNTPIREMPVYLYDLDQLRSGGNEQYFLMVLQTFRENKIKRKFENHSWSYSTLAYGKFTEQVTYQYKKDGKLIKDVRIIEFTKRGGPKDKALVKIVFNDRRKGDLHRKQKDVLPKQVLQMQKSQLQGPAKESQDKCESCSKLKEMYDSLLQQKEQELDDVKKKLKEMYVSLLQQKEQELDDVKKKWQEAQAQVAKLGLSVNDIQEIIRAGVQALKQVGASLHPRQHDEEHDDAGGLTYRQDGGENGPGLRSAVGCGICCQDS
ncbi:hypothetical protein U9M48_006970 [Paspalum notatum var. saurae]|uniref:Uncharacterized protein n=1 Tax=Paspalum notatum var. saurae TaxID=547442 RepID=A0AAQ3PUG1_PASNO